MDDVGRYFKARRKGFEMEPEVFFLGRREKFDSSNI